MLLHGGRLSSIPGFARAWFHHSFFFVLMKILISSEQTSNIVFQDAKQLIRLSWNQQVEEQIAVLSANKNHAFISFLLPPFLTHFVPLPPSSLPVDMRKPNEVLAEVGGHERYINAVHWAPHSGNHLCTSGEDGLTCIHSCEYASSSSGSSGDMKTETEGDSAEGAFVTNPILAYGTSVRFFLSFFSFLHFSSLFLLL